MSQRAGHTITIINLLRLTPKLERSTVTHRVIFNQTILGIRNLHPYVIVSDQIANYSFPFLYTWYGIHELLGQSNVLLKAQFMLFLWHSYDYCRLYPKAPYHPYFITYCSSIYNTGLQKDGKHRTIGP